MVKAAILPTALLLAACAGKRDQPPPASARSAAASGAPAPASASAGTPALTSPSVDRAVRASCDGVAAFWRSRDSAVVRVVDSVLAPWTESEPRPACVVLVDEEHGMRRDTAATLQVDTGPRQLGPALALTRGSGAGWTPLYHYSADGPDGTDMGYQRGTVRCLVERSWDGGDDSDTTYVPADWFKEQTTCWSVPAGITAADTGS